MKTVLLAIAMFFALAAYSQNKVTITCFLSASYSKKAPVDYGILNKVLPDSLQSILINPYKQYNMVNIEAIVLWMQLNGWKLKSADGGDRLSAAYTYIFIKEINLDNKALAIYKEKVIEVSKKR